MMRLNKKVIMLTALLIVIGVVVSCSQPTIDKPSIEEPTNPNIQNIINELNRLQNIVYEAIQLLLMQLPGISTIFMTVLLMCHPTAVLI